VVLATGSGAANIRGASEMTTATPTDQIVLTEPRAAHDVRAEGAGVTDSPARRKELSASFRCLAFWRSG
jgi:hypothetical protein